MALPFSLPSASFQRITRGTGGLFPRPAPKAGFWATFNADFSVGGRLRVGLRAKKVNRGDESIRDRGSYQRTQLLNRIQTVEHDG